MPRGKPLCSCCAAQKTRGVALGKLMQDTMLAWQLAQDPGFCRVRPSPVSLGPVFRITSGVLCRGLSPAVIPEILATESYQGA